MNKAGRLVIPEYLDQLCPSVSIERSPRVVGKTKWVAQPGRIVYFDHNEGELGTAPDLPKPSVGAAACACLPSEVGADLPTRLHLRRACRSEGVAELPTPRVMR
jgi:hypothetical protein